MFKLEALPYKNNDLEPYISSKTLDFHHMKHHSTYIDNLNKNIEKTNFENKSLEEIIITSWKEKQIQIFNNAAQAWNHSFYWHCMCKNGGGLPKDILLKKIVSSFDSFEHFVNLFKTAALSQFGSGWAWLVKNNGVLEIIKTSNAETPIAIGLVPLLTIDVWEHAYYLDYQNKRGDYVEVFLKHLVNWDFVLKNLDK